MQKAKAIQFGLIAKQQATQLIEKKYTVQRFLNQVAKARTCRIILDPGGMLLKSEYYVSNFL